MKSCSTYKLHDERLASRKVAEYFVRKMFGKGRQPNSIICRLGNIYSSIFYLQVLNNSLLKKWTWVGMQFANAQMCTS